MREHGFIFKKLLNRNIEIIRGNTVYVFGHSDGTLALIMFGLGGLSMK